MQRTHEVRDGESIARSYRYFLNFAAAMHTAAPSSAALGSRISSGFTLTGRGNRDKTTESRTSLPFRQIRRP
jgi:hypothetical protein